MSKVTSTATFIEAARRIHGDTYDYSQTVYRGACEPIVIVCKSHGLFTLGWAASHYSKKGSGCQKCSGCFVQVKDTASFIATSREIHGDVYDYSQSKYTGSEDPIVIICRKCGPFTLAYAQSHYRNKKPCGCKSCCKMNTLQQKGRLLLCVTCHEWAKHGTLHGVCKACQKTQEGIKHIEWTLWAKRSLNGFLKYQRRVAVNTKTVWSSWSLRKYNAIQRRQDKYGTQKQKPQWKDWEEWAVTQQNKLRNGESLWQGKFRRWVASLKERAGQK